MTKEKAALLVKQRHAKCADYIASVKRKKSWSPADKAMTAAGFLEEQEAMKLAYAALTGEELSV